MNSFVIQNARVFTEEGFVSQDLYTQGAYISAMPSTQDECVHIDAQDCYVIPGLVDIHSHGAMGYDFCDASDEAIDAICRFEAAHGICAYCATTMTFPEERLSSIMSVAAHHADKEDAAALVGINMEGPYISPHKVGAQNPQYVQSPNIDMFDRLQAQAHGLIKIVDLAPEEPGALEFIKARKDDVRISLAHTCASYDQAYGAYQAGACHVTHLYNAMPPLAHREPGVIGAAMDCGATPEIITDGIHIHPAAVRAAWKLFGPERMIIVSDSMMATGLEDGVYELGGQEVHVRNKQARLADGTLAGSATDLMSCMQIAVRDMGIPLHWAVRAASTNPARALGIQEEFGNLRPGALANVVILSKDLELVGVILRGIRLR